MNDRNNQQLLAEVLADLSPADFRAAALTVTLRAAGRRRRWRQTRQAGGALALIIFATWLAWQRQPPKNIPVSPIAKVVLAKSYQLVETQPFPAGEMVTTETFPAANRISSDSPVALVATASGGFRYINDAQLFALLGNRPAVLIHTGPQSKELVFANPEDQKQLLGN